MKSTMVSWVVVNKETKEIKWVVSEAIDCGRDVSPLFDTKEEAEKWEEEYNKPNNYCLSL